MNKYLTLLQSKIYLAGLFITKEDSQSYAIISPLNQNKIALAANSTINDVDIAISQAQIAFDAWKNLSSLERAEYLLNISDYMLKNKDELGHLLHLEQGKSVPEAIGEILYSSSYFKWFAHQAQSLHGETLNSPCINKQMYTIKQPIGVCAAITPFNFPSAMLARKLAPALAAGCSMIIKPASDTPFSALVYGIIADEINLPKGLISILPADQENSINIGKRICESETVRKLSFTGSSHTGKILMSQCAGNIKRLSLELGGNAPFIVTKCANVQTAIDDAIKNKFRNSGQTCVCANRFFIHKDILHEFTDKIKQEIEILNITQPISPLINFKAIEKVDKLVKNALNKGAKLELGGNIQHNLYYQRTLLTNVDKTMDIYHQEIFGPVISIMSYENIKDAVKQANDTPYGLAAYVYTENINEINYFTRNLEYGMLGINNAAFSSPAFPFGGIKQSGFGKEGSIYGLEDYTITKAICLADGEA